MNIHRIHRAVSLAHLINTNITKINFIRNKSSRHDSSLVRINTHHTKIKLKKRWKKKKNTETEREREKRIWLTVLRERVRMYNPLTLASLISFSESSYFFFHSIFIRSMCDFWFKINLRIFFILISSNLARCQTVSLQCPQHWLSCFGALFSDSISFCCAFNGLQWTQNVYVLLTKPNECSRLSVEFSWQIL